VIHFADEALLEVRSGKGGNGCIAFRREKYIPKGGPAGGDGGRGGDVIFFIKHNVRTLTHLRFKHVFKAQNGGDGEGSNRSGRDGDDVLIPVPPGTKLKNPETGEVIFDFTDDTNTNTLKDGILASGAQFVFLKGGKGGWGNVHFKSSTNQAPRYMHEGTLGEVKKIVVELSIMADVGLVGFPNAGKSSLLDYFTNARPKIAPYPFTTKIPNLGVLHYQHAGIEDARDIIIADIPGIIEGAASGAGLGIAFLKHISRCEALLLMIDCSDDACYDAYSILLGEIAGYGERGQGESLINKKRIVLCNKIDTEGGEERAKKVAQLISALNPHERIIPLSIHARKGLKAVESAIVELVDSQLAVHTAKQTTDDFLQSRAISDYRPEQFPGESTVVDEV